MLPQVLFWLGFISVPLAWLVWYFGSEIEILRPVLTNITDPALRAALQEAHAERLGIWVAVWPVSFLVLKSYPRKENAGINKHLPAGDERFGSRLAELNWRYDPKRRPVRRVMSSLEPKRESR